MVESWEDGWDEIFEIRHNLAHESEETVIGFNYIDKFVVDDDREHKEIPEGSIVVFERGIVPLKPIF